MNSLQSTHSLVVGYIVWVLGIFGAHRFYYGRQVTGTIWFFTGGVLLIGWVVDLFLMPSLDRQADTRYRPGRFDYTIAWILLTFLGVFGIHRFYMGNVSYKRKCHGNVSNNDSFCRTGFVASALLRLNAF